MCNCNTLTRLGGPIHGPRDYYCKECGDQYVAKPFEITVKFGTVSATQTSDPVQTALAERVKPVYVAVYVVDIGVEKPHLVFCDESTE